MPKLTSEIGFAAGYTGYLGSGIAYTTSYIKELSIEDGIRNYQYLDRLTALYAEHGVELHRRQPGFLTGTNIPPSIAIGAAFRPGPGPSSRRDSSHSRARSAPRSFFAALSRSSRQPLVHRTATVQEHSSAFSRTNT